MALSVFAFLISSPPIDGEKVHTECRFFYPIAVSLAMSRDGSSGGVIRMAAITSDGLERKVLAGNELPTFFEG